MTATIAALTALFRSLTATASTIALVRRQLDAPNDLDRVMYEITRSAAEAINFSLRQVTDALAHRDAPVGPAADDAEDRHVDVCTACGSYIAAPIDDCEAPEFDVTVIGSGTSAVIEGGIDFEVALRCNGKEFATGDVTLTRRPSDGSLSSDHAGDPSEWVDRLLLLALDERISRSYESDAAQAEAMRSVLSLIEAEARAAHR